MSPGTHSRLAPSAAHRWTHCTGSLKLIESLPPADQNTTSIYAEEGTKAHDVAANWLKDAHATVECDEEMTRHVGVFVDAVQARQAELKAELHVEQWLSLDRIRPTPPTQMGGTADAVLVSDEWLEVWDLKYGQGVVVEAAQNVQLLTYLLGAILKYGTRPHYAVTIVQPRAYHEAGPVRRWEPSGSEIQQYRYEMLKAAHEAVGPNAKLKAGEWCQFCPARGHCPELAEHSKLLSMTDFTDVPAPPNPATLPLEVAADLLTKVPILEMWVKALKERVESELRAGHPVPGWKLVEKRALRQWNDSDEVKAWAKQAGHKLKDITVTELLSPAQMEKVVGKKHLPQGLYSSVSSGLTIAREGDRRQAIILESGETFPLLPAAVDDQ